LLTGKRLIDLTRVLQPGKEKFALDIETFFVDELLPGFHRPEGQWYIMQEWKISSHIGTHIESPHHHIENGPDVASLSIEQLIGEAVVLDFHTKKPEEAITPADLENSTVEVHDGDIVLIYTGYDKDYGKPNYNRPFLSLASVRWLIQRRIACLGIDASGIEKYKAESQPGHLLLFERGIPVIEELTNLGKITQPRFWFIGLPLPIQRADACPIRAVAVENAES
jgi:arylformamidase